MLRRNHKQQCSPHSLHRSPPPSCSQLMFWRVYFLGKASENANGRSWHIVYTVTQSRLPPRLCHLCTAWFWPNVMRKQLNWKQIWHPYIFLLLFVFQVAQFTPTSWKSQACFPNTVQKPMKQKSLQGTSGVSSQSLPKHQHILTYLRFAFVPCFTPKDLNFVSSIRFLVPSSFFLSLPLFLPFPVFFFFPYIGSFSCIIMLLSRKLLPLTNENTP